MTTFKVFKSKKSEQEVYFRLTEGLNSITLEAVQADGKRFFNGGILTITSNGTIQRIKGVNENLGLSLDTDRKVIIKSRLLGQLKEGICT